VADPRKRNLSELEVVILGLIGADGPCTAYAIRQTLKESLSPQWSGSAGAVYPAVTRLEERGLIRSREQVTGRRRSLALGLTQKGKRTLAGWLGSPVDSMILGVPADPLRTRLRFLKLLPLEAQIGFLNEAIEFIKFDQTRIQKDIRERTKSGDPYQVAMARGALHASRARQRMITELLTALSR
jgi:DNA-binding PadR family transcriptional regulator